MVFWYALSGITLKYISSGILIKFVLFCSALFYLWIFLTKENSINYLFPLGFLNGFIMGNYWSALNLNQYIFTHQQRRIKYFGLSLALMNLFQAIGPAIGGVIIFLGNRYLSFINFAGYSLLFLSVSLILFGLSLLVGKLPRHDKIDFSYKQIVKSKRKKDWKLILLQQAVLGSYDTSLMIVVIILSFVIVKHEIILGYTQTLAFILGSIGGLMGAKYLQVNNNLYWIGSIGIFVGILIFALFQNLFGLLLFILITGLTAPFLDTWVSTIYFQALDKNIVNWQKQYYLMIERDLILGLTRVVSLLLLFLLINTGNQIKLARIWLYILLFLPLILGLLIREYEKLKT
ncbi:hypothetical protein A2153_00855 [Candidatus Gottesmanbacteria bacterium RBG_16_38_7b]|uniref:Major facilitator superfamily (MFS) profile domain-containing protein n=1 Tax=Candidatus Gottesmanbacteria bacterium RBG_16_38_7b TaxID=1798372 RepID=A0A1F5YHG5_9BACT|nr:MAG: hypothetical protein A2153_00855 [Candidatus Gottesmanbacteria bacterium RBG_16_38_7b]